MKLTLNLEKIKQSVSTPEKFKLLGFAKGKSGKGNYIRVHKNSLAMVRLKLKELTRRNQGKKVWAVMEKVKVFTRGWLDYFHIADMRRIATEWNSWLRRRFRMCI